MEDYVRVTPNPTVVHLRPPVSVRQVSYIVDSETPWLGEPRTDPVPTEG